MILPLINPRKRVSAATARKITLKRRLIGKPLKFGKSTIAGKRYVKTPTGLYRLTKKKAVRKSPALRRGFINPFKETSMYRVSLRPRRRASSRRRNPRHKKGTFGIYRPVIHYGKRKGSKKAVFYRGPKTRFFKSKRSIRVNARRRRSYRRNPEVTTVATNPRRRRSATRYSYRSHRRTRRNPKFKLPMGMDKTVLAAVKVAGGIGAGFVGLMLSAKISRMVVPAMNTAKFIGIGNVVLGAVAAAFIKNKAVKDAALIVAAVGIYDLISKNIPIGLPVIVADPTGIFSLLKGDDDEPGVIGSSYQETGADYAPALGASYQEAGDDISYGGDTFELD